MQWILLLLLHARLCLGVKQWMFKRCDQNPFCERNRDFAAECGSQVYYVDPKSVNVENPANVTGYVIKTLTEQESKVAVAANENVKLPFRLEVTTDDIVHFIMDEEVRNYDNMPEKELAGLLNQKRFDPEQYVLDGEQERHPTVTPHVVKHSATQLIIGFGKNNAVELDFKNVKLVVSHNGEPQVVLNKRNLLNFEHLRWREDGERNNYWEDKFDKYTDVHVRGPESVALDTTFEGYTDLYGIPEHADVLSLRDTAGKEPYRLFNVDIFEYETNSPMPMYGSIPFITAHKQGHAVGVFWMNAADTYVDIVKSSSSLSHWMSETGKLDVYILVGDKPGDVLASYGQLTGTSQLPQQFAIAYHQCRWNYMSQDELLGVHTKMDEFSFPYDVIWLDLEWSDDRRYFQWDTSKFPDAEEMMASLDETQRKLVVLNDPHIKANIDYNVYTELRDEGALLKAQDGTKDYHEHCWPGETTWIDTFHPKIGKLWAKFHALGTKLGGMAQNLYIWSDMSEPSVFSGSESTAHKGVMHHGGWQHRDVHNIYGHTVFNVTYDALRERYGGKQRPFILTRSYFAGSQKLGPTWTGDNQAEWEHLQASTPMVLTMGVSGYPFVGADVGGFFRNPSDELLTRWYQLGAFYPFFRSHAHIESKYREPYLLDGHWQSSTRDAIELRYQLLPELYTLFWDASQTLQPIVRPMYFDYSEDPKFNAVDDQFMVGSSLLVKPVVTNGAKEVTVLLPKNEVFYIYADGTKIKAANEVKVDVSRVEHGIPVFVRGGSIVFRKDRKRRASELMKNDPYTLLIAVSADGTASGHLYVDDGVSFEYLNDDFLVVDVELKNNMISGRVRHSARSAFSKIVVERIVLYGADATGAEVDGKQIDVLHVGNAVVVRNPRVEIGSNWDIRLTK